MASEADVIYLVRLAVEDWARGDIAGAESWSIAAWEVAEDATGGWGEQVGNPA